MKRLVLMLMMSAGIAMGQHPANLAYCWYAGGNAWLPLASTGTAVSFTPPAVSLYGTSGANSVPLACDSSGHLIGGSAGFAPDITQPPYNAKCDGTTDDSVAIQAAMDANSAIQLPLSTPDNQQQCNVASTLIQNNAVLTVYLNGGTLAYTGTGTMLSGNPITGSSQSLYGTFQDGYLQLVSNTGTPTAIDATDWLTLRFIAASVFAQNGYHGITHATNIDADFAIVEGDSSTGTSGAVSLTNVSQIVNLTAANGSSLYISDTSSIPTLDVTAGGVALSGNGFVDALTGTPSKGVWCTHNSACQYFFLYSAAGTPLPTCNTAAKGTLALVSDATAPTYNGAYASGGAVTANVLCNGTGWVTH